MIKYLKQKTTTTTRTTSTQHYLVWDVIAHTDKHHCSVINVQLNRNWFTCHWFLATVSRVIFHIPHIAGLYSPRSWHRFSPLEDVLDGSVATVGIELEKQGCAEGVAVCDKAENGHGNLRQHRPGDLCHDHLQVMDADPHAVLGWGATGTVVVYMGYTASC